VITDTVTTIAANDVYNPIVVRGIRKDATTIELQISNFEGLPSAGNPLEAGVDTIGVWFDHSAWPLSPDRANPNRFRYALSTLVSGGSSTYKKEVTVTELSAGGDSSYFFAASPFWRNTTTASGDSLPPFDTANGDEVMMFDTVPVDNPLTITSLTYDGDTTVTLKIGNTGAADAKASQLGIWYGFTNQPDFSAAQWINFGTVRENSTYTAPPIQSAAFGQATDTVYVAFVIMGDNGLVSTEKVASVIVGHERPDNDINLTASKISSYQIALNWTRPDSVRIWYGTSEVPLVHDPDPSVFMQHIPASGRVSDTLSTFQPSTTYYFGLQVFSNGLWSTITSFSSAAAKTDSASHLLTITNTIAFDTAWFDSALNSVMISYRVNTVDFGARQVQAGVMYSSEGTPEAVTSSMKVFDMLNPADTIQLPADQGISANTTYYISMWERVAGENWIPPTVSSIGTFIVYNLSKATVKYFEGQDSVLTALGGSVILRRPIVWVGVNTDTLFTHITEIPGNAGFLQTGSAFYFRNKLPSAKFYIGIKVSDIPTNVDVSSARLYRDSAGVFLVEHGSYVENGVVWSLTNNLKFPFVAMFDTIRPQLTFDAAICDTGAILNDKEPAITSFIMRDNIANMVWSFKYGKGNEGYSFGTSGDTLSAVSDTVIHTIAAEYSDPSYGLRARIILSDGLHTDTINVSRRIRTQTTDDFFTIAKVWTPLRVSAVPDDSGLAVPLGVFADGTKKSINYDMTKIRLFKWDTYAAGTAQPDKWVEYSSSTANLFSFAPGRVLWIKTSVEQPIKFGSGITVSLKEPVSITLPPQNWTDIATPFKFPVKLADILSATGSNADSLMFYIWEKAESTYVARPLYIASVAELAANRNYIQLEHGPKTDAYTVYNPFATEIILKIPPVPPVLSNAIPAGKMLNTESWNVRLSWSAGSGISHIYCGHNAEGFSPDFGPVPPSFGKVVAGIAGLQNSLCGYAVREKPDAGGGFYYEVRFCNSDSRDRTISYSIDNQYNLPAGVETAVFNPVTMTSEPASQIQTAGLGAGQTEYRWVIAGTKAYIEEFGRKFMPFRLGLNRVYPNPARGKVMISFTVPYGGLRNLSFSVYDLTGRKVWEHSPEKKLLPGAHTIQWDGQNMKGHNAASGVYILQMRAMTQGSAKPQVFKAKITCVR
jgi:hypothetical protein